MSGLPTEYPLTLYRGDSYSWRFRFWDDEAKTQPSDLSGVTAEAEIRDKSAGLSVMILECTVEEPNVVLVVLHAAAWDDYTPPKGVWDLQLTYPGGGVYTPIGGPVKITADVTGSVRVAASVA